MKIKLATQEQLENVKSETFENMLKKQDKLTAGDNVQISADNIISATFKAEDISYGGRFAWEYNETNDSLDLVVYE